MSKKAPAIIEQKICKICGKKIIPKSKNQVTCLSPECIKANTNLYQSNRYHKKNPTAICIICGNTYPQKVYNQRVCCNECRAEWKNRRVSLYGRKKREAKNEPNAICSDCGAEYYWTETTPDHCVACSEKRYQHDIKDGVQMTKDAPGQPRMMPPAGVESSSCPDMSSTNKPHCTQIDWLDFNVLGRGMMDANICPCM